MAKRVKDAKALARQWATEAAPSLPGFAGAFFHGSANWLADEAVLPATSDLDVMVVLAGAEPPEKPGKFDYRNVMLEVSYLAADEVQSPEQVLGQYHLAGSFHVPSVILDPSGRLTELQTAVANDYAKREWVRRRCEDARRRALRNLNSLRESDPWHDQVTAWLFGTGVTTHILLVAGLRNPTVRRRYVAVRELLADYGQADFHETLLAQLGCARLDRARAEHHLAALAEAFDTAKTVIKTPFFFAVDISDTARPIAIDGSQEMIVRGDHREAVFWLVATFARSQKVLHHDAPVEMRHRFDDRFRDLVADLGITSFADLQQRVRQVQASLPQVWDMAEVIMAANRDIVD